MKKVLIQKSLLIIFAITLFSFYNCEKYKKIKVIQYDYNIRTTPIKLKEKFDFENNTCHIFIEESDIDIIQSIIEKECTKLEKKEKEYNVFIIFESKNDTYIGYYPYAFELSRLYRLNYINPIFSITAQIVDINNESYYKVPNYYLSKIRIEIY